MHNFDLFRRKMTRSLNFWRSNITRSTKSITAGARHVVVRIDKPRAFGVRRTVKVYLHAIYETADIANPRPAGPR